MDKDLDFLKSLTVLYVEDDEETREQLAQFLRRRTRAQILAPHGLAGLEAFRASRPRLVVTDILMPGMDGLTMAREIRQLDPRVPIIVTTAFEHQEYLMRAIEVGLDKYVVKPVQAPRLEAALLDCARRLRLEEEAAALATQHVQAQKMEALGALAGGMAHDFNNLLQVILAGVALAREELPPEAFAATLLEDAERATQQACQLGRLLVTVARGQGPVLRETDLLSLLESSVGPRLAGTPMTWEAEIAPDLGPVSLDPTQLSLVFRHLARNALEAMPEGGPGSLRLKARAVRLAARQVWPLEPGDYLQITFQDDGPGILEAHLPHLFEPYFSTKERSVQKGMGLGLSLCYALLRGHEGMITAESSPGQGAAFHIYLPLTEKPQDPAASLGLATSLP